jgi:SAM-dependent methyltransferase
MPYDKMASARSAPRLHSSTYSLEDQERMSAAKNYLAWQGRLILPELGRRVVEVGCGMGNFTGKLLDRELVVAVDMEHECVEAFQRRYRGHDNLQALVCGPGSASFADLARVHPDSCLCVNVLEHIEDDAGAISSMAAILEPGGVIVLWVPAFQALYGNVDQQLGHYRRYRRAEVIRLAETTGLLVRKAHYVNLAGFFLWWASSHLLRQQAWRPGQVVSYDRLVVPWLSRLESVVRPPFGQTIFAVLHKR